MAKQKPPAAPKAASGNSREARTAARKARNIAKNPKGYTAPGGKPHPRPASPLITRAIFPGLAQETHGAPAWLISPVGVTLDVAFSPRRDDGDPRNQWFRRDSLGRLIPISV